MVWLCDTLRASHAHVFVLPLLGMGEVVAEVSVEAQLPARCSICVLDTIESVWMFKRALCVHLILAREINNIAQPRWRCWCWPWCRSSSCSRDHVVEVKVLVGFYDSLCASHANSLVATLVGKGEVVASFRVCTLLMAPFQVHIFQTVQAINVLIGALGVSRILDIWRSRRRKQQERCEHSKTKEILHLWLSCHLLPRETTKAS
mmetsp:Transcript_6120/g.8316  ORF Transcript_6120/g.8316 Transcript_6120/m.8316 type:complete len:204 (+) Transcript_6120:377-988(+)